MYLSNWLNVQLVVRLLCTSVSLAASVSATDNDGDTPLHVCMVGERNAGAGDRVSLQSISLPNNISVTF